MHAHAGCMQLHTATGDNYSYIPYASSVCSFVIISLVHYNCISLDIFLKVYPPLSLMMLGRCSYIQVHEHAALLQSIIGNFKSIIGLQAYSQKSAKVHAYISGKSLLPRMLLYV